MKIIYFIYAISLYFRLFGDKIGEDDNGNAVRVDCQSAWDTAKFIWLEDNF